MARFLLETHYPAIAVPEAADGNLGGARCVTRFYVAPAHFDKGLVVYGALDAALSDPAVGVVITTGGTGISARDSAYETISARLDKRLDGFGELFRVLSYEEIGAAAMLSRAVGGIASGRPLFALPGSTAAVRLGIEQLILPQVGHLHHELTRHADRS